MLYTKLYASPVGILEISATEQGLASVMFREAEKCPSPQRNESPEMGEWVAKCMEQLDEYFAGKRQEFAIDLDIQGTDFQKSVWNKLIEIPYAENISYLTLARRLGNEKAIRAVGTTNGKNPVSIIVPCHRVIGANGTLVGYGGDLWRKRWLLDHEARVVGKPKPEQMSLF